MSNEGMLEEYRVLREEILHSDRVGVEIISVAFAATSILLAQGIASASPVMCLLPVPLLLMAYVYTAAKRLAIWRIASYCRKYIEPLAIGIKWETRLYASRANAPGGATGFRAWLSTLRAEYLMFVLLAAVSVACSAFFGVAAGVHWTFYLVPGILFVLFTTVSTMSYQALRRMGRRGSTHEECWPPLAAKRISDIPFDIRCSPDSPSGPPFAGGHHGVRWSDLGCPDSPGVIRVTGIGDVAITQQDLDTAEELGGDPWFQLDAASEAGCRVRRYALGLAVPEDPVA